MFYLSLIEHKMLLPPRLLNLPLQDAIKEELQNIFLDKVVTISLCIFLPFCPCIFMLSTLKYWVKMEIIVCNEGYIKAGTLYFNLWHQKNWWWLYISRWRCFNLYGKPWLFLFVIVFSLFFCASILSLIDVFYVNIVLSIWTIYPPWISNLCVVCGDFFHFIYLCFFQ